MKWPDDDIAMIKTGDWPYKSVKGGISRMLCVKKPPLVHGHGDYEFGCIICTAKSTVFKTSPFNWTSNAEKVEYDSVEELVKSGWMVD